MERWIDPFAVTPELKDDHRVALGSILTRRSAAIDKAARPISGLNVIAKISFGGALSLRDDAAKRAYKGPLFEALPGDLIISKIRVGQGSFSLVPDTIDHLAVSPEYPVYAPDLTKVEPRYLARVLRSPDFMKQLTDAASGNTTKRRITPSFFEKRTILLPPVADQRALVEAAEAAEAEAVALEAQAQAAELEAAAAFEADLGLASPPPLPDRPLFIARFADLDRWSHDAVLRAQAAPAAVAAWPMVRLGQVIGDLTVGWSPKAMDRPANPDEWGVLKLNAISTGTFDSSANKALPSVLTPRAALEVKADDILILRGSGVTRLVGAVAHVESTRDHLMIPDLVFRVVDLDKSRIIADFLVAAMRTGSVRSQIEAKRTGRAPMMQKITKPALRSLTFPLPPLEEQARLVKALLMARQTAAELRGQALALRAQARADFEAAVAD